MPMQGFGHRTSGNYTPYIQWSHRDGKWSDRENYNIAFKGVAADFRYVRTGWGYFERGERPQWVWDSAVGRPSPQPGKGWRRAIALRLLLPNGELRELKTTSAGLCGPIARLYDEFELTTEFAAGQFPIIDQVDTESAGQVNSSEIFDPVLKIVGFRPCPPEFAAPPPAEEAKPAASAKPARAVATRPDADLDDSIPFATSDPGAEPIPVLQKRIVA
jgi:hypothetical protein